MKDIPDLEKDLLARLSAATPGCQVMQVAGSRWGRLISPAAANAVARPEQGLRVLFVGSWTLGLLALEALLSLETRASDGVRLVGMVTDDPLDVDAKISVKKRFWRYYDAPEREQYEWAILHRALPLGIPCYTGEVKSDAFHQILAQWDPEAIVMAAFGQMIDETIIDYPAYGMYNVHPSDLLHAHGAGPQPWEDLVERRAGSTRVTLHQVSPTIDDGDIVGQSPEINVRLPDGSPSDDVRAIGEKTLVPVRAMVRELVTALSRRKASRAKGPLETLSFEQVFGPDFKAQLMEPLNPGKRGHILPLPEDEQEYSV
jgi:methionyl-tRNA formyltransferase